MLKKKNIHSQKFTSEMLVFIVFISIRCDISSWFVCITPNVWFRHNKMFWYRKMLFSCPNQIWLHIQVRFRTQMYEIIISEIDFEKLSVYYRSLTGVTVLCKVRKYNRTVRTNYILGRVCTLWFKSYER